MLTIMLGVANIIRKPLATRTRHRLHYQYDQRRRIGDGLRVLLFLFGGSRSGRC